LFLDTRSHDLLTILRGEFILLRRHSNTKNNISRRFGRTALIAAAAAAVTATAGALAAAPLAHADGGLGSDTYLAYESNTGLLSNFNLGIPGSTNLGMEPGTHPTISALSSNGYQITFAANNDELYTVGPRGSGFLGQFLTQGTSPSMTILSNGSYEIAFEGVNGDLWTYNGNTGAQDMRLGMDNGTSPSITSQPNGGFEIAFQANTGDLWVTGSAGTGDLGLGMDNNTSPSITLPNGGGAQYEIAFQANNGHLWIAGTAGTGDTGHSVAPDSSPAITTLNQNGGFQVAYVQRLAGTPAPEGGLLATYGTDGSQTFTATTVAAGTSPSITGFFLDGRCGNGQIGYRIAYDDRGVGQGPRLGTVVYEGGSSPNGVAGGTVTGLLMDPGSSPSITGSNDHC
jgi:hypothetical protein